MQELALKTRHDYFLSNKWVFHTIVTPIEEDGVRVGKSIRGAHPRKRRGIKSFQRLHDDFHLRICKHLVHRCSTET